MVRKLVALNMSIIIIVTLFANTVFAQTTANSLNLNDGQFCNELLHSNNDNVITIDGQRYDANKVSGSYEQGWHYYPGIYHQDASSTLYIWENYSGLPITVPTNVTIFLRGNVEGDSSNPAISICGRANIHTYANVRIAGYEQHPAIKADSQVFIYGIGDSDKSGEFEIIGGNALTPAIVASKVSFTDKFFYSGENYDCLFTTGIYNNEHILKLVPEGNNYSISVSKGDTVPTPPKHNEYVFIGWKVVNNSDLIHANDMSKWFMPGDIVDIDADNIMLQASYLNANRSSAAIVLNGNGGVTEDNSKYLVTLASTYELSLYATAQKNFIKDGYDFNGFNSSPSGNGTSYTYNDSLTDDGKTFVYNLYAQWIKESTLTLNTESLNLAVGKSSTLKATRTPSDKKDTVTWYSDDENIATVSSKGAVKAKGVGTTTIHAVTKSGLEASCKVSTYAPIKTLKMSRSSASMVVGGPDLELSFTASPENHTDAITWSSSNENIATVDENGVITAHSQGKVKISATSGSGKKATCTITIGVPADAVEFTVLKSTSLAVGKTLTLKAKAFRLDGAKPVSTNVRYEIIDGNDCATLDAKGKLKAIRTGTVTARAYPEACLEQVYDEVTINVCIPATKVVLSQKSSDMVVGAEPLYLDAVLSPENHTDTLAWSSSNENIATVDKDGVVTAHSQGKVKITATSGSGKKATCTITVGVPADTVEFSALKSTSLAVGKTLTVKAKASRQDKVKPVSTDVFYEIVEGNEFATIDAKGKIKATGTGQITVRATAKASLNGAYDEVTINVCIPATKVVLSQKSATVTAGNELCLEAILSPSNNTDTLTWSSSNDSIATVDKNGIVTAHKKGSVKITATAGSGKKATCSVKVVMPEFD